MILHFSSQHIPSRNVSKHSAHFFYKKTEMLTISNQFPQLSLRRRHPQRHLLHGGGVHVQGGNQRGDVRGWVRRLLHQWDKNDLILKKKEF